MRPDTRALARLLQTISVLACVLTVAGATTAQECQQTITADVVALDQPFMFNRLGTSQPQGMIYALKRDVVNAATLESCDDPKANCKAGQVALRPDKRPRPIALRVNVKQCLQINFTNFIDPNPPQNSGLPATTAASLHLVGLELVPARDGRNPPQPGIDSDATYVGVNNDSQAVPNGKTKIYKYYAKEEGTFLAYSAAGDWAGQLQSGLFGAVTVEPEHAEWYRSQVTNEDLRLASYYVKETSDRTKTVSVTEHPEMMLTREFNEGGQPLTATVEGQPRQVWTINSLQPSRQTIQTARVVVIDNRIVMLDGRPLINYNALYPTNHPRAGTPILRMIDATQKIVHTDLTALITGPNAGRFSYADNSPSFYEVPASPDRRQPFREFTVIYHEAFGAVQPFAQFYDTPLNGVLGANGSGAGTDTFAINYGMAGIAAEVLANRLGLGPMGNKDSVDLKYEEFFLSSWANGDPAMIVDVPANAPNQVVGTSATGTKVVNPLGAGGTPSFTQPPSNQKATRVFYPDDTSNVYHSYMRDHMKFRLLHGGGGITHIHHLHAQQWLKSPNSDDGHYLDSQMINPGSSYTLEMVHGGSGNRNLTVGDSIFHCHFYPHFASGMWSLWRVHDVFEAGTPLDKKTGQPVAGSRALPDGEIAAGVPIPAVVPLPTLAMAPPPARVTLTADGRRVSVEDLTTADGKRYRNPGFPFFVPGMAGHRAPHPPLDFAWEEDDKGTPLLDANGQKKLLDGGLPRHLVLDGKTVREFHTRWDFTKDFILYKDGKPVDGGLVAFELPEGGTEVERAAMAAHAQRTHPSFQPNGDPGNFILNGLPPAHGAPYADPAVDDDGNARVNTRRYQGAAIQLNVVFNKKGWHFPQQRMLTLWNDVSPTVQGTRPPQPFFFRANTGETVEFWHTNLVPDYYELDDFQVRTPTDLLGQHIHLVKFDVTSSDGAGNGWNYEDGTFSPDEVRNRIDAINLSGGLHNFDTATQFRGTRQTILKAKPAPAIFGTPPAGQNWLGAQTTIQRWDTDPLLNNRGIDRTLRTVFTHDHFGPSTHQQIGLYGGLLVEPEGSKWFDPITGELFYDLRLRRDGGPTSWQADIRTFNTADSYREFALEFQDFQLAYTNLSPAPNRNGTPPSVPASPLFGVCPNPDPNTQNCNVTQIVAQLNQGGAIPPALMQSFSRNGITLSADATVAVQSAGKTWQINNPLNSPKDGSPASCSHPSVVCNRYPVALNADTTIGLQVTNLDMSPGWSSAQTAISAPFDSANAVSGAPYPMLISSVPMQGTFSLNYRNEPLPLRVNTRPTNMLSPAPAGNFTPSNPARAADLSFAFSSIERFDRDLNRQPVLGGQIDPTCDPGKFLCFTFPKRPLVPEGSNGYFGPDPFTPLLRAYANDNVQIRTLVGAHHNPHYFNLHGVKWFKEPSHTTSGYRSSQTMGLSEHFEMLFRLPSATTTRTRPFADYLYQASAGTDGLTNGLWGIMRAYSSPVDKLMPLPNNPQPKTNAPAEASASANAPASANATGAESAPAAARPPAGATNARKYHVVATTAAQALPAGTLVYNSRGQLVTTNPATFAPQTNIENPFALIYVLAENLTSPTASGKLKPGARIEPLILRAAAGEWIEITLTNAFDPTNVKTNTTFTQTTPALSPFTAPTPSPTTTPTPTPTPTPPLPVIPLQTSTTAGLHPLLLAYDVSTSDGANVGFNPIQTVAPGESRKMYWYAGSLDERGRETPIELGTINLLPSDPLQQHTKGLVGALIVEPKGSSWCEDANGSASASVYMQSVRCEDIRRGSQKIKPAFREFVVITQDDLTLYSGNQNGVPQPFGATSSSVNNRTEPMSYRYPAASTAGDVSASQSNRQVQAEPQTPIFSASAGTPVRFRMLHPAGGPGADGNVITIDGHVWQEEPYVNDSREIGYNSESQWMGSRGQHGARSNVEIVLESAGGTYKVPGDYIYRSLIALLGGGDMQAGVWGIFRVLPPGRDAVYISQATPKGTREIIINGSNTINPDTGSFAPTNQLYAGGIDPRTQKCSGRPLLVPVLPNAADGSWKASIPGAQLQKICVQSAFGGVQEFTPATSTVKPTATALAIGNPLPRPTGRRYRKNK